MRAYGQLWVKPVKSADSQLIGSDHHWRVRHLLLAPHRLGFFLAMLVLVASAAWWLLVQFDRVSVTVALPYVTSPTLVHATAMTFGFFPLFFVGFLFTAVPKWLRVEMLETRVFTVPLLMQATGWLLWLGGSHWHTVLVLSGLALAWSGFTRTAWLFWRMVWRSREVDQLHARTVGVAWLIGCLSLGGLLANLVLGATAAALACVLTGLWGFVIVVFVTVAHRMVPFFTSNAMPFIAAWKPFWALGLMLTSAALEVLAVWLEVDGPMQGPMAPVWMLVRGSMELLSGFVLLWLALMWGLAQSLKNRLLAMLHIGFLWLGLGLLLGGVAQLLGLVQGTPVLSLGSLHAVAMGCLASLMLAMVTRVSCGFTGRSVVADRAIWTLFWLLQVSVLLRIAAAAQSAWASWLLLPAALLWASVVLTWSWRLGGWYGRVRPDGRAG